MAIIFDPLRALEQRRADVARTEANSGGELSVSGLFSTLGWGEFLAVEPIRFGVVFTELPAICHGFALDVPGSLVPGRYPLASGFVAAWEQDANGYYVGAFVAAVVSAGYGFDAVLAINGYALTHTFAFAGPGLRDVPAAIIGEF